MVGQGVEKFEKVCGNIVIAIPEEYQRKWRWDEEFFAALIVVKMTDSEKILSSVSKVFDHHWDHFTLDNSAEHINKFFSSVFGMIPGQSVFTSEEASGLVLFATWWPWGDGDKASLRIGIFSPEEKILTKEETKEKLCTWFAL